jgi:hypothetical protein
MARVGILRRSSLAFFAGLTLAAGAGLSASQAQAQNGFTMALAPSPRLLDAWWTPDYYDVLYDESCDNPHLRVRARNKPAIRIDNNGSSTAPITTFTLKINEGPYVFSTGDFVTDNFTDYIRDSIYTDPGVSIDSSSVSADFKTLTVNFSGLAPGTKAIFNIDLDTTDPMGFPFPDYRNVLFGAPLDVGEPPTTPATFTMSFGPPLETISGSFTQITTPPSQQNEPVRPYGEPDKMEILTIEGVVPEPSSIVMAGGMGLAVVVAGLRARKRR